MNAKTTKFFLLAAAICGLLAVAAGAFGAHGLKEWLTPELMSIWQTAALYQSLHALALLGVGLAGLCRSQLPLQACGYCFLGGIAIFSGSLYALALTGEKWLGAITPIGGVLFLVGWASMAWAFSKLTEE